MESSGGKSEKPCSQPLCQTYLLPSGDHIRSEVIFPGVFITLPSHRHLQTCWWVWLYINGIILLLSFCSFFSPPLWRCQWAFSYQYTEAVVQTYMHLMGPPSSWCRAQALPEGCPVVSTLGLCCQGVLGPKFAWPPEWFLVFFSPQFLKLW